MISPNKPLSMLIDEAIENDIDYAIESKDRDVEQIPFDLNEEEI